VVPVRVCERVVAKALRAYLVFTGRAASITVIHVPIVAFLAALDIIVSAAICDLFADTALAWVTDPGLAKPV